MGNRTYWYLIGYNAEIFEDDYYHPQIAKVKGEVAIASELFPSKSDIKEEISKQHGGMRVDEVSLNFVYEFKTVYDYKNFIK